MSTSCGRWRTSSFTVWRAEPGSRRGIRGGGRGSVLIVEDDPSSAELLSAVLEDEGFQPIVCSDARDAIGPFRHLQPVAILIDWVLPGGSGIELCRVIRGLDPVVPIVFVSGRTDEASVSRGLDAGADDFISKPFRPQELVARLDAHLRKLGTLPPAPGGEHEVEPRGTRMVGEVEIDLAARTARVRGRPVPLGLLEFRLLEYLVHNAGVALSREQILHEVHGYEDIQTDRVDLLVRRLRAKLGLGEWIVAVPGYGYRLERPRR
jgi:two-component system, OmpR family, response regulator MtrA